MQGLNNLHEYTGLQALEMQTLTRAEMEEQVAKPLDHSILEYRVLCDGRSTSAFIYGGYTWFSRAMVLANPVLVNSVAISVM